MKRSRGCELPETYNPQIIRELFYEQSKPWKAHVKHLVTQIWDTMMLVLNMGIDHMADETTAARLRTHIIQPAIEVLKKKLEDMIGVILTPYQRTSYYVLW